MLRLSVLSVLVVLGFSSNLFALTQADIDKAEAVALKDMKLTKAEREKVLVEAASAAAYEQNGWYDTILEGEYSLNGSAEAKEIQLYFIGQKLICYTVFISAPAIFTGGGECEYNENEKRYIGEDCVDGAISILKYFDEEWNEVEADTYADFE